MTKSLEQINWEFLNQYPLKESAPQLVMPPDDFEQLLADIMKELDDSPNDADQLIWDVERDLNSVSYQPENTIELPKPEERRKKKRSLAKQVSDIILCSLIGVILIAAVTFNFKSGNGFAFLGYSFFTMLTDSMQSEIQKGALVIITKTDTNSISIGEDITFIQNDSSTITHRVIHIIENYEDSGARGFRTQGLENPKPDSEIVCTEKIIGVVKFSIPGLGYILDSISENIGLALLLLGVVLFMTIAISRLLSRRRI